MKKLLFLGLVGVLVLNGCGQQAAEDQAQQISGSIEDLIGQNKTFKCELVAQNEDNIMAGTTYIADQMARSDFQVAMSENQTITSHMINDGTWMYTWSDEYPQQAMKIKLDTMQSEQFEAEEVQGQAQNYGLNNYEAQLDYKCYNWTKDSQMFIPPAEINFMDFSQMLEQAQQFMGSMDLGEQTMTEDYDPAYLCNKCDEIADAQSRQMCRQSLGCD